MYKIHIPRSARRDIREAALWYNEQKPGLGKRFAHTVLRKIELISEQPHLYEVRYDEIRMALTPIFPFTIHFKVYEKRRVIAILGVFHTSRNPENWSKRQ
ncbi:type II toxin-antitoxin system RelE/ParE family toxin [Dyadobacter luticola]|uniref:Type II toxin-antitoxin system RelE/ParE family toxin n=1 Tax=Dyadobacter luticola TaxID=1979387 RepID=A0A5R9KPJ5_9BACT|nr:type II toxin-antitoxin system RelE/ParE family toxin [Dyadobacter luticola]